MTDVKELVQDLQKQGYIITPEALKMIKEADNPDELIHKALQCIQEPIIDIKCFETKEKTKITPEEKKQEETYLFNPIGKKIESQVKIINNGISEKSSSTGKYDDFVEHFRNRYSKIAEILKNRGLNGYVPVNMLKKKQNEKTKIIIMINEKRTTKNGHIFITGEDPTGQVNVLIPKSSRELLSFADKIIPDEIIAIDGRLSKELYIADKIYQPDLPLREMQKTEEDIALVTISDMHIGSKLFLKKQFEEFIEWINGRKGDPGQRKLAEKVKYITIAGDTVDGIGIYPGQEESLSITDIFEQYQKFTEYIKQIPEHIHIIIAPGNHDAVKNADPQPKLPEELIPELYKMKNVTLVGSPSLISIHGIKVLIYHGTCFIDIINSIPGSKFDAGALMMKEMLIRRHVHPVYGGKPITPEKEDSMVITTVPDIFHCGESHNNSYENYKGTMCINSGTWQSLTDYQIKQGHKATPAIVPVVELKYGKIKVINFDKEI